MAIRDMQRFAELRRQGGNTIAERRALLEAHRDEVLERIGELQRDLAAVTDTITHYQHLETSDAHQHPDTRD
jgi:DNA-binding transcriptional MerR regulator